MINDWLCASGLIRARITAQVPEILIVEPAVGLQDIEARCLQNPSAFVLYDGDRIGDTAGRGQAQIIHQRWLVVLAVRNLRDIPGGSGVMEQAGSLLAKLLLHLQGWAPSPDHRPLTRVQGPLPGSSVGWGYFPLAFETPLSAVGDGIRS